MQTIRIPSSFEEGGEEGYIVLHAVEEVERRTWEQRLDAAWAFQDVEATKTHTKPHKSYTCTNQKQRTAKDEKKRTIPCSIKR